MHIRKLEYKDYDDILSKWWKDWRWEYSPPRDFLPDDGTGGLIIYDGDIPVCAGFIYMSNSKLGWVEFVVSNIEYKNKENRKLYLSTLIESLGNILKEAGAKYTYVSLKSESLIKIYEDLGYVKGSKGVFEMIKKL